VRRKLLELLMCPLCEGSLELIVHKEEDGDIIEGFLICKRCNVKFPIKEGIVDMREAAKYIENME